MASLLIIACQESGNPRWASDSFRSESRRVLFGVLQDTAVGAGLSPYLVCSLCWFRDKLPGSLDHIPEKALTALRLPDNRLSGLKIYESPAQEQVRRQLTELLAKGTADRTIPFNALTRKPLSAKTALGVATYGMFETDLAALSKKVFAEMAESSKAERSFCALVRAAATDIH